MITFRKIQIRLYDKLFREVPGVHKSPKHSEPEPERFDCVGEISNLPANKRHRNVHIKMRGSNANQSTDAQAADWVIIFPKGQCGTFNHGASSTHFPHPQTGYSTTRDPHSSHRLSFATRERAMAFAKDQGWNYTADKPITVSRSEKHNLTQNSYAGTLKYQPPPEKEELDSDFEFFEGQYYKGRFEY